MFKNLINWVKSEKILFISGICALGTMFFVPPDAQYLSYIDVRVLCLLFCLMAVIAGFQSCGIFHRLSSFLLKRSRNRHMLGFTLVMLPFFVSMVVTNDVALLTFIPFTLLLLEQIGFSNRIIPILVLQTVAANLGSMATPVGNPQNLYLYACYELSPSEFFSVMLPLVLVSFLLLGCASFFVLPQKPVSVRITGKIYKPEKLPVYLLLFFLCLLTVFRLFPYRILTVLIILILAVTDRELLKQPDYGLLLTFVCFFIVSGNLGRMEAVHDLVRSLLEKSTLFTSAAVSQVISNVPSAVLLSGFTENWKPLLQGVNIGGLGTPVASLASLITLKLYMASPEAKGSRFLLLFTVVNLTGLFLLLAAASAGI